jgi:hypothetical protein
MQNKFVLKKMLSRFQKPIQYSLAIDNTGVLELNILIGQKIKINFNGEIYCIKCGRKTNKSFAQGYCYPCFVSAPETEECVLKPELCQAHLGIARDMEYAKENCLQEQFVYLASSDVIKVGVTRSSQIPTRWIDQGASFAIKVANTPNRYTAGLIEVELKKQFPDKTNWRAMLTNKINPVPDFSDALRKIETSLSLELSKFLLKGEVAAHLDYPVNKYPEKLSTIDLEKTNEFEKTLSGIKGQYMIFSDGSVMNIRKHSGYKIEFEY